MTYAVVEAAVQTLLQAMTEFANADVTQGDYRRLDDGTNNIAVLTPGAFEQDGVAQAGARKSIRNWNVIIDLFRKYVDDGNTWTNFTATRDALIVQLEKYPSLDSTAGVTLVTMSAGSDPAEIFDDDDNGPFFLFQRIRVTVNERADLSGGEYT